MTDVGSEYMGKRFLTVSGYTCQRWDVQIPHAHPYTAPEMFPDNSLAEASNYCRNPNKRLGTGPWCYTTNKQMEWEPCGIIHCSGESLCC